MADAGQTYSNHTRFFPLFHFFVFPVLAINMFVTIWSLYKAPSLSSVWTFVVALTLVLFALAARLMAMTVQDRVIRLEMQLRLREVLPAELQPRIADLTRDQLVALRFASDAELPALVRQSLDGALKSRTDIKKAVKNWQGDYLRA
jgi:hypothetical protein